jgi:hypothetical protein
VGGGDASPDSPGETSTTDVKDSASDVSVKDGSPDASDASAVLFSTVADIFTAQCIGCHKSNDGSVTGLVDLQTPTGLYARLTTPLPSGQEGQCGFSDAGTDGGDGGDAAPANRTLVVPGDTNASFLYLKITGNQPAGCGVRMPRIAVTGADGAPAGSVGCDLADGGAAAKCLSQQDMDLIRDWIAQGAHEFPPDN